MKTVIVGAGQSGAWVARTLHEHMPDTQIALIGEEMRAPYERPPLSKSVLAGSESDPSYLLSTEQAKSNGIDLRLGVRATGVDRNRKMISLSTGDQIAYDKLVIAAGGRARIPNLSGTALPGVHTLRSWDDAMRIRVALDRGGSRLLVLGGGWIGLEVAATARHLGAQVTLLEGSSRLCARSIPPVISDFLLQRHRDNGVDIRLDSSLSAIERNPDGSLDAVTNLGRLTVDLVVIGVGLAPGVELAVECGLDVDNGIVVDASGKTSDPDIYAVGDVANQPCDWPGMQVGSRIRLESWANAQNQGIAVGRSLAGLPVSRAEMPWFWSDQYDLNLQVLGLPIPEEPYVVRGDMKGDKFCLFQFHEGRLHSVIAVNAARDLKLAKRWMLAGSYPSATQLEDLEFRLDKFKG
jgi:3-phenylpropionate/trans-cinnamate dioxygenase ferredoxin reductase subunit